ncbi:MAG: hypothetical protein ACKPGK_15480 [Verrucomicrobiota bacterium]
MFIVEGVDTFPDGEGDLAESCFKDIDDALPKAFLSAFMATFLSAFLAALLAAEAFEAGDVGHAVGVLELVEALSEGDHKLVGQGHQPVDQAQEFPDLARRHRACGHGPVCRCAADR